MLTRWAAKPKGFTIVELLIVIVIIAILAAITIVAFNGVQKRANNNSALSELMQWRKTFDLYKSQEGNYPTLADGGYCLGTGFPIGFGGVSRCRDYNNNTATSYIESDNAALLTELRKVATLPVGAKKPINGTVGVYIQSSSTSIVITMVIQGSTTTECPSPTAYAYTDGVGRLLCNVTLTR